MFAIRRPKNPGKTPFSPSPRNASAKYTIGTVVFSGQTFQLQHVIDRISPRDGS